MVIYPQNIPSVPKVLLGEKSAISLQKLFHITHKKQKNYESFIISYDGSFGSL